MSSIQNLRTQNFFCFQALQMMELSFHTAEEKSLSMQ